MSHINFLLAFLIIATCGRSVESRGIAWLMVLVLSLAFFVSWIIGVLL